MPHFICGSDYKTNDLYFVSCILKFIVDNDTSLINSEWGLLEGMSMGCPKIKADSNHFLSLVM